MLLVDNIFRFVQAGSEVSGLLGRLPSRSATSPRWTEIFQLKAPIASHCGAGYLACRRSTCPPTTSPTRPASAFAHLNAGGGSLAPIAEKGIYPAIDPWIRHRRS